MLSAKGDWHLQKPADCSQSSGAAPRQGALHGWAVLNSPAGHVLVMRVIVFLFNNPLYVITALIEPEVTESCALLS